MVFRALLGNNARLHLKICLKIEKKKKKIYILEEGGDCIGNTTSGAYVLYNFYSCFLFY